MGTTYLTPIREQNINPMRIISKKPLIQHWTARPTSQVPLESWYAEARRAVWTTPGDVKAKYGSASILKGSRVVFNIHGNAFRLVVAINYQAGVVYVRFIGTHKEYDEIDAETI